MIDIIGTIYEPGTYDEHGEELTPAVALPGWHVNTTPSYLAEHADLAPFVVTPSRLRRVWAGDDPENPTQTVALRFEDEAEALALGIGVTPEI